MRNFHFLENIENIKNTTIFFYISDILIFSKISWYFRTQRLQAVQNAAARLVSGARLQDHITPSSSSSSNKVHPSISRVSRNSYIGYGYHSSGAWSTSRLFWRTRQSMDVYRRTWLGTGSLGPPIFRRSWSSVRPHVSLTDAPQRRSGIDFHRGRKIKE